eukprot:804809-Ditylum_brightwellii.AAC.1
MNLYNGWEYLINNSGGTFKGGKAAVASTSEKLENGEDKNLDQDSFATVSYTHLRAHETLRHL